MRAHRKLLLVLCAVLALHCLPAEAAKNDASSSQTDSSAPSVTQPKPAAILPEMIGKISRLSAKFNEARETGAPALEILSPVTRSERSGSSTTLEGASENLPANLVYVRISREYLNDRVARVVQRELEFNDLILGAEVRGLAHTNGVTSLVLHSNDQAASGEVVFLGNIYARTKGRQGPLTLHSRAYTSFVASKPLVITGAGLQLLPAESIAQTHSVTTDIESSLPPVRARIAENVAWRRLRQVRDQAESIAADNAAERINRQLDREVARVVADVRSRLKLKLAALEDGWSPGLKAHFRSRPEAIEAVLHRQDATVDERQFALPAVVGNPDVAVRVHRSLLARAISDPQLRNLLQPLLKGLAGGTPIVPVVATTGGDHRPTLTYTTRWTPDREWLVLDYTSPPRVANVSPERTVAR